MVAPLAPLPAVELAPVIVGLIAWDSEAEAAEFEPVFRTYLDKAMPGAHHLELRFSPWQLRYLGPLWLASLATLLALAARALAHPARRRRST